jgi:protein-disulfide isomerase
MDKQPDPSQRREVGLFGFSAVIGLLGLGLSAYSLKNHLAVKATGASGAICNINQTFSCDAVSNSVYSELFGFPVALLGVGFFAALGVLALLALFTDKNKSEYLAGIYGLSFIGTISSVILGLIAWLGVGAFCLSCIGVYLLTFAQLFMVLKLKSSVKPNLSLKLLFNGLTTAAMVVALALVGYNFFKPTAPAAQETAATESGVDSQILGSQVSPIVVSKSAYSGLGEDYRKGGDDAKVTVVEWSDFECPACARAEPLLRQIANEYGNRILFVFKNYPLDRSCNSSMKGDLHKFACQAAIVGRCAGQFGNFWAFHDKAFAEQSNISTANIKSWGKAAGLTDEQMDQCLTSKDVAAKVKEDIEQGDKAGVSGTPAIFINGRRYNGQFSVAQLRMAIDSELKK